jgi:prepilin-type N-terminal cleavage/methylation domain-containing protein
MALKVSPSKLGHIARKKSRRASKGFTLIEVLFVIALMTFIGIAGITQTINSQKQLSFMNTFKDLMAKIREPRMYSVTNLTVPDVYNSLGAGAGQLYIPNGYGVYIRRKTTTDATFGTITADEYIVGVFADHAKGSIMPGGSLTNPGKFDSGTPENGSDFPIGPEYTIDGLKYGIRIYTNDDLQDLKDGNWATVGQEITQSSNGDYYIAFIYEPPLGNYSQDTNVQQLIGRSPLYIRMYNLRDTRINRYIAVFSSGIAEAFYETALTNLTSPQLVPAAEPPL